MAASGWSDAFAGGPEEGELSVGPSFDEAGGLPVRDAFDVRVSGKEFPSAPVRERHAASAEERRTALLAVEQFEHAVALRGGVTEDPRIEEELSSCAAVPPGSARTASGDGARPQALHVAEEPVQPE